MSESLPQDGVGIVCDSQLDQYANPIRQRVREMFASESSGHDFYHLDRVYNLSLHLQTKEGGNRLVIGVAALLHDVHRLMKQEDGRLTLPEESLLTVNRLLSEVDFPRELKPSVIQAVRLHEDYSFAAQNRTTESVETLILQDADRIDAIGAIGIGRCFTFTGAHGVPMWIPEMPLDDRAFDPAVADPSAIHHFYRKLLKLTDSMNTETAKRLAKARHEYIQDFAERFIKEWQGEL